MPRGGFLWSTTRKTVIYLEEYEINFTSHAGEASAFHQSNRFFIIVAAPHLYKEKFGREGDN